jgi:ATP-dependent Lon protease
MKLSKNTIIKNAIKIKNVLKDSSNTETISFLKEKTIYFQEIILNTIISVQLYKHYDIFSNSDITICIQNLNEIFDKSLEILQLIELNNSNTSENIENIITILQSIVDKLAIILCGFGTQKMEDLLYVCMGSQYTKIKGNSEAHEDKIKLIKKYIHPIGYKSILGKPGLQKEPNINENNNAELQNSFLTTDNYELCSNKMSEETVRLESSCSYECYDIDIMNNKNNFFNKVYGIRIVIQDEKNTKALVINGIIDDIPINSVSNQYINQRKHQILTNITDSSNIDKAIMKKMIELMTLKDFLIYGIDDIYKKYWLVMKDISFIKQNKIDVIIKRFMEMDAISQRNMLLNLLSYTKDDTVQYITYLLYDIITATNDFSSVVVDNTDNKEQMQIYDSFPWTAKMQFKEVMKFTVKFTQDMIHKYDMNKISIEQQIYLMKAPEYIKEKAINKLKEIKGKSDESGSKAKQYLEGLLKIPFGVYRTEPILKRVKTINQNFHAIVSKFDNEIIKKPKYANTEIFYNSNNIIDTIKRERHLNAIHTLTELSTKEINGVIKNIKKLAKDHNLQINTITEQSTHKGKINAISDFLNKNEKHKLDIYKWINPNKEVNYNKNIDDVLQIQNEIKNVEVDIENVIKILDESIHGHEYAKNQIVKIIGQWINGEQTGYCFGFEGSPGVGKTSVAKKGLANCLKDENGISRPFAFIALGGSCNGSTLEGHSYTYVNSIWGRIVDVLMESKCMNPIIYIDELDKVSKTEHGKEIIGILTHLIDTTQNDTFQDKYYSGINLDLSKALFIFSYNDPDNIDRILLDRIHRIKFDNLSLEDKLVIVKDYLLEDLDNKMGFSNTIVLTDEVIEYIIESYTLEPGVRKLKEVLFDLYGEINLELLKYSNKEINIPVVIKIEDLETKYLKKYHKIHEQKIHSKNKTGIISGLWANALGKGGIIPIETMFFPSTTFLDLKLTGMQGDVMKESMNVAKSLAWNLTPNTRKKELQKQFEETKCQGLHIHCPQGSVSKDGPSAGTAITIAIYSLLNDIPISNTIAITGEINLQGDVTAIGGLESKILGGVRAGVKTFIFPEENDKEFADFMEKQSNNTILEDIQFIQVKCIQETFKYVFGI